MRERPKKQPTKADGQWTAGRVFQTTDALHARQREAGVTRAASYLHVPPEARARVRALAAKPEFMFSEMLEITKDLPEPVKLALHDDLRRRTFVPENVSTARAKGLDPGAIVCGKGRAHNSSVGHAIDAVGANYDQEKEAGLPDARAFLHVPPGIRTQVIALTAKPEFDYREFQEIIKDLPDGAQVAATGLLRRRAYVPPSLREALSKGHDVSGYRCGNGRAQTKLGKDRIVSTHELDDASAGVRKMAAISAQIGSAILTLGAGGAMEAGLALRGAASLKDVIGVAVPVIGEAAKVLAVADPEHADFYGPIAAGAGLFGSVADVMKITQLTGTAAKLELVAGGVGIMDAGLGIAEAALDTAQDEKLRMDILKVRTAMQVTRAAAGGAAKGLSDP